MAGILRNPFPLDSYAHPCYSPLHEGLTPPPTSPFPLDWGKVRASLVLAEGMGVKIRQRHLPRTCYISATF